MSGIDVVVVGCGVFGLSTILELTKKGYKVLGLDAYAVPSELSAANDYNKIIRIEYSDLFTTRLAAEALRAWESDSLYTPYYVKSGRVILSPENSRSVRSQYEQTSYKNLETLGLSQSITPVRDAAHLGELVPEFKDSNLPQRFNMVYNADCGMGLSAKSMVAVYEEAKNAGAEFVFGSSGRAVDVTSGCVTTASGAKFFADKIIVTAGASTGLIVPLDNQTRPLGVFVSHVRLTDKEFDKYKTMPIFFSAQHGYFFPPDRDTKLLKIGVTTCDGYAEAKDRFNPAKTIRVPRYTVDHPTKTLPRDHVQDVRKLLSLVTPDLADHDLIDSKICWIADSSDSYFLIDECPHLKNVFVGTGDSSHAYKFLPNIGKYIVQRMEGTLSEEAAEKWKWKKDPEFQDVKMAASRYPRPHLDLDKTVFMNTKL